MVGCGGGSLRLIGSAPAGGAGFGADGMAPGGGAMPLGTVPVGGAVLNSAAPVGGAVLVGTGTGDAVPCGGTASCPVPIGSGLPMRSMLPMGGGPVGLVSSFGVIFLVALSFGVI